MAMMPTSRDPPDKMEPATGTSVIPAVSKAIPIAAVRRIPRRLPSAPAGSEDAAKAKAMLPLTTPMKSVPYPSRSRYRLSSTDTKPK